MNAKKKAITAVIVLIASLTILGCGSVTLLRATATPFATIQPYTDVVPLEWPVASLTDQQIEQVRECDIEELAAQRYPSQLESEDLHQAFQATSACDWATLAFAYTNRGDTQDAPPELGANVFVKTITENPGFAFVSPLFYSYFGAIPLVKAPPFSEQEIITARIEYSWAGWGNPHNISYTLDITQADTMPVVEGTLVRKGEPLGTETNPVKTQIEKRLVQALAAALTDFLPVRAPLALETCTDSFPQWLVSITFKDMTKLNLTTNGSNFVNAGGPWQIKIADQHYVQFSADFLQAVYSILQDLKLSFGQPKGMFCSPEENIFGKAFP